MKKILTSLVALLMAATLIFTFAACGGEKEPEETTVLETTVEDADIDVEGETTVVDETTAAADETTAEAESTEAPTEIVTNAEGETSVVVAETTTAASAAPTAKADIVALFNEATAKAVNGKAGYKKVNKTELQKLEMGALGKLSVVRDAVGSFLGEGTNTYNVKKGQASKELTKSTLTAADVTAATCKLSADGKYYEITLVVKNEKNPVKGNSALNRLTNDFKDHKEMKTGLLESDAQVNTVDCTVKTAKVTAKIAVADKKIVSLNYVISTDAYLTNVKYSIASVKVVTGTIYTNVTYSGFSY